MEKKENAAAGRIKLKQNKFTVAAWNALTPIRENPFPAQVLFTIFYRLALDLIYVTVLSPIYGYIGFTTTILPLRYLTSLLATAAFAPLVVALLNDFSPSSILLSFINYLYFIPLTSYYGCRGTETSFFFVSLLYWGLLMLLQTRIPKLLLKPISSKHATLSMAALTIFAILFVFAISGIYTGFRLTLDFINVYEIRAEAATYEMSVIASYVLGTMPIILAVLLVYWLRSRKMVVAILLIVTYLFLFSIDASKSIFFFLFLIVAAFVFYRDWMLRWLPGLLVLVSGVPFLERALGGSWILSLFFRRMMYVPVQISEHYALFFSQNPLNLFQDGIMGKLSFDSIYPVDISDVIGAFMGDFSSANNGLVGDLYANIPVALGLFLMPLILIVCFRVFDLLAERIPRKFLLPFCVFYANGFINSSWSTVLLSHGFLAACLLLYFFPKEEQLA